MAAVWQLSVLIHDAAASVYALHDETAQHGGVKDVSERSVLKARAAALLGEGSALAEALEKLVVKPLLGNSLWPFPSDEVNASRPLAPLELCSYRLLAPLVRSSLLRRPRGR